MDGLLHQHEDGREHRHFSRGFTIGGQVIPDRDGSEEHRHGSMSLAGGPVNEDESGPVVWIEGEER